MPALDLPQLSEEEKNNLDSPFTIKAFKNALKDLNTGKSTGSDGFPQQILGRPGTTSHEESGVLNCGGHSFE